MNYFINVSKIIFDLGGTGNVAKNLRIKPSTVSNWKKKNKIPNIYFDKISNLIFQFNTNNSIEDQAHNLSFDTKLYKILIIISGGVASYKSLELIRVFKKANIDINVILTKSAQEFINPILITSLNGKTCFTDLFSEDEQQNMNHIKLARQNDLILVAPTTANLMAKLANGLADDLATNVLLATDNKIILAPSMNPYMWLNSATQKNIEILKNRDIKFIEPDDGYMACGEEGVGRLPDIETISNYIFNELSYKSKKINSLIYNNKIKNLKVMVTAGPTQENIDPIRFLSNSSSGKQGYAIADEFKKNGANVILISGPTTIVNPRVDKFIKVKSAEEMLKAVENNMPADIFIGTAAVSDWKLIPFDIKNNQINVNKKIKKSNYKLDNLIFKIKENPDILKKVSHHKNRPKLVVGFAAETHNLIENAKSKLRSKSIDFIVANQINKKNQVFGNDTNSITIIEKEKLEKFKNKSKIDIAKIIVNKIINSYI